MVARFCGYETIVSFMFIRTYKPSGTPRCGRAFEGRTLDRELVWLLKAFFFRFRRLQDAQIP